MSGSKIYIVCHNSYYVQYESSLKGNIGAKSSQQVLKKFHGITRGINKP